MGDIDMQAYNNKTDWNSDVEAHSDMTEPDWQKTYPRYARKRNYSEDDDGTVGRGKSEPFSENARKREKSRPSSLIPIARNATSTLYSRFYLWEPSS